MSKFLNLVGVVLIVASIVVSILFNAYGLIIFPVFFALGCINMGLGTIIEMLQEVRDNKVK